MSEGVVAPEEHLCAILRVDRPANIPGVYHVLALPEALWVVWQQWGPCYRTPTGRL